MKKLLLMTLSTLLISGHAFAFIADDVTVTYKSCDIYMPSKIKSVYTTDGRSNRTDHTYIARELLQEVESILTEKGYNPYFFKRKDGLALRLRYEYDVSSSFGTTHHDLYSYLDIIENGNYSHFDEFRYYRARNFSEGDYNYFFIKIIKAFPFCKEE